jgi:hypothetical protein
MANVFLSHRSADSDAALRLARDIEARGHRVWIDQWKVDLGDSITGKMNEGLTGTTVLVLCLSDAGVLSPWMSREWLSALARQLNGENVRILPVRLSGGEPPAIIADLKYADAVKDYSQALEQILRALERS